jgi:hypothetical protein
LSSAGASQADIRNLIDRVTLSRTAIQVQLSEAAEAQADARTLTLRWTLPSPDRKGEIIHGASDANASVKPSLYASALRGPVSTPDEVLTLRSHLDVRIARRAQTIAKLAQLISERDIQKHGGLRRVLLVQSQRLESLAKERFLSLGGEALVEHGSESNGGESEHNQEQPAEV